VNLLTRLRPRPNEESRSSFVNFGGYPYPLGGAGVTFTQNGETVTPPDQSLVGYARHAYKQNGPVFALMMVRQLVFSTVEFKWQRLATRELFGGPGLRPIEEPWPGGTTQNLLAKMVNDADVAGNSYWRRDGGNLVRLRPDWVSVVSGVLPKGGSELVGYRYMEGGDPKRSEFFLPTEVAHFMPLQDPEHPWRGMSWLTPVIREMMGDQAATTHKLKFFENAATPNIAVSLPKEVSPEQFPEWQRLIASQNEGAENAYKTMVLGGGADIEVVGRDLSQLDFKSTQGAGETRLAAAAGVHPVIVGFSEGLSGSSLNAGNYAQARRRFADGTLDPLWREAAGSLQRVVRPPDSGARLWFDIRHVPFLRQDAKDEAEIFKVQASSLRSLLDAGYKPDAAVGAIEAAELGLLVGEHTGKLSVQLQNIDGQPDDDGDGLQEGDDDE
jgi:phage portal protein BeeE